MSNGELEEIFLNYQFNDVLDIMLEEKMISKERYDYYNYLYYNELEYKEMFIEEFLERK